jgi:protocatechuate 3,4-dioxygenase beta subunit
LNAAVLALLLALLPAAAAPPSAVSGRVFTADGTPLPGARVELLGAESVYEAGRRELAGRWRPPAVAAVRSDGEGRFRLALPAPGIWRLRIESPGRAALEYGPEALLEPAELTWAMLPPAAPVTVRVRSPGGAPVAGARVAAVAMVVGPRREGGARPAWRPVPGGGTTGAGGIARLDAAEGGALAVSAQAPGWAGAEAEATLERGIDLPLIPGEERTLEVRNPRDRPLPDVLVLTAGGGEPLGLTGADGRLAVRLAPGEEAAVELRTAEGLVGGGALPPPAGEGPAVLAVAPPRRLSGSILAAPDRRPIAGAWVWWQEEPAVAAVSDERGAFALPLPPTAGARVLRVAAPGYLGYARRLAVAAAPPLPAAEVLLTPEVTAAGRVVDAAGSPVAGAALVAGPTTGERPEAAALPPPGAGFATSDAAGRFRLGGLRPGSAYRLNAGKTGYAPATASLPAAGPGGSHGGLELVLGPGHRAFGSVVDLDEAPIAGARVILMPASRDDLAIARLSLAFDPAANGPPFRALSDAGGRFELSNLPPGRYDLVVAAPGFAVAMVPGVTMPEAPSPAPLGTVLLEPALSLEGRTVDGDGAPLGGVEVRAASPGSGADLLLQLLAAAPGSEAVSGADGRFRLAGRRRGERLTLSASRRGYLQATAPGVEVPAPEPVVLVLARAASVAGEVDDPTGAPVAGAALHLCRDEGPPLPGRPAACPGGALSTTADGEGRFRFDAAAPGRWTLTATAAGWAPGRLEGIEVADGGEVAGLRVALAAGSRLVGRVTDDAGEAVVGAKIGVVSTTAAGTSHWARGESDDSGAYAVEGLAPGFAEVSAYHPDYEKLSRELEVDSGEQRLDLNLRRRRQGREVAGTVVDPSGAPVAGALVELRVPPTRGARGGRFPGPVVSGPDGAFALADASDGEYLARAEAQGYAAGDSAPFSVAGADVAGIEIRLEPGAAVVGTLRGLDLDELSQAAVYAGRVGGERRTGTVGYDSSYRVEGLAPGDWEVNAFLASGRHAGGRVTIEPGEARAELDLVFGGGYTLAGRVRLGGRPVAGAQVTAESASRHAWTRTDYRGAFRLEGLEAGSYELEIGDVEQGIARRREVELSEDLEIDVDLAAVTVGGRVVDGDDGRPLEGAAVRLVALQGSAPGPLAGAARSGPDGGFSFAEVADGSYRLQVHLPGYALYQEAIAVTAAGGQDALEVPLAASPGLAVVVRTAAGEAPPRIALAARDGDGRPALSGSFALDPEGRLDLDTLPAGTWRLTVGAPGNATVTVAATAPGPEVAVVLPPPATLVVEVPELAGGGAAAFVALTDPEGRRLTPVTPFGTLQEHWPLVGGRVEIPNLPAGGCTVTVTAGEGRSWSAVTTAVAGEATVVILE